MVALNIAMSREEVFRAIGPTSGAVVDTVELGAKRDGHIIAAQSILKVILR
jgi:CO/xanthine dehydrogenase Mo-binding subunit